MSTRSLRPKLKHAGFSLVEALITIAIIGVLTGLVVSSVSNASRDTSRMIAKQQAATMQTTLDAWISGTRADGTSNVRSSTTGQIVSVESLRATWTAAPTTSARFNLIKHYLDDTLADHFIANTTNSAKLQSEALINARQYLTLGDWTSGNYPKVSIVSE